MNNMNDITWQDYLYFCEINNLRPCRATSLNLFFKLGI